MTIVIPIGRKRFYYNRKINCLPAEGTIQYGDSIEMLDPADLYRFAGLGQGRLGIPILLELGQHFGLFTGWTHHRPEPGLWLWRPVESGRECPDPWEPHP